VLLHWFTGCHVADVLAAVGLEFSDLFPEKLDTSVHHVDGIRRPFYGREILTSVVFEATVVAVAAGTLREQGYLRPDDEARLALAYERLANALTVMGGSA
jgi:hypothetical protein